MVNNVIQKEIVGKCSYKQTFFLEIIQTEGTSPLEYTDLVVKVSIRRITTDKQRSGKAPLLSENALGVLLQAPMSNLDQTFPVNMCC